MSNNLSKSIKRIQNSLDEQQLSVTVIKDVINLFLSDVVQTLSEGQNYVINNFGSFYTLDYPEKIGKNPLNRGTYVSKAHSVPKFKFSKKVKKVIASSNTSTQEKIKTSL